jgi:hypothetical protein
MFFHWKLQPAKTMHETWAMAKENNEEKTGRNKTVENLQPSRAASDSCRANSGKKSNLPDGR